MKPGRTLHVRCSTWEQVEMFHTRKLRRGRLLSMKVPFETELGAHVTLGLELPNQVVLAIDGTVQQAAPIEGDGGRMWIEVEMHGFTDEVIARIKSIAAAAVAPRAPTVAAPDAIPPAPHTRRSSASFSSEELPADERKLFQHLTAELRRLRQVAVHEVLGVPRDADPDTIRRGWMHLVRRHHPDLVARRHAPAITHLAEELTILTNRAYDRLRAALLADGRVQTAGPAMRSLPGWLVGFDDIASTHTPPRARAASPAAVVATAAPQSSSAQGGEAFEQRARAMLGDGDANNAQEVLAAALCVYPRSRPLRSLYYVASAIGALEKGELMLATSQLETALAHYEECTEAAAILEQLRKHGGTSADAMRRLFR